MESNSFSDKSTQVYQTDLMIDEEDTYCANTTCGKQIQHARQKPPDINEPSKQTPDSTPFASEDFLEREELDEMKEVKMEESIGSKNIHVCPTEVMTDEEDTYCSNPTCSERIPDARQRSSDISVSPKRTIDSTLSASKDFPKRVEFASMTEIQAEGSNGSNDNSEEGKTDVHISEVDNIEIKTFMPNQNQPYKVSDKSLETNSNRDDIKEGFSPFESEEVMLADLTEIPTTEEELITVISIIGEANAVVDERDQEEKQNEKSLTLVEEEAERLTAKTGEISNKSPTWRYDGIDQPHEKTVRVSTDEVLTKTFDYDEIEGTQSSASELPGTSFGSQRTNEVPPARYMYSVESHPAPLNTDSNTSDNSSPTTMNFFGNFPQVAFITTSRIISFMLEKKHLMQEELRMFEEHLKEEPLILSSLFIFLLYYIIYFVCYCGLVHECVC